LKHQKIRTKLKAGVSLVDHNKRLAERRANNQIRYVSKKEIFDPFLRLASAITINAFEQYRKSLIELKSLPQNQRDGRIEKRLRSAIKNIKEDLLTNDNPSILYLEANKHAMDKSKIKRTFREIENNA